MKLIRRVVWSIAVVALAACGAKAPSGAQAASVASGSPPPSPSASSDALLATPTATGAGRPSGTAQRCDGTGAVTYHDAPVLEATLPTRVAGRDLATWSVAGRCWLEVLVDDDKQIEEILADTNQPAALDLSHLAQAVAGRSETAADPPYFVYAANRPVSQDEIGLRLLLLLGGAGFHDVEAGANLDHYEKATIAGKEVYVGTDAMVDHTDHQSGRPYLYQTDRTMYVVITDDAAWAEEAIALLP